MAKLIIGFSKPKGFRIVSKLIRWVDGVPFSHTYIRWYSTFFDRDIIYQASGSAVNFMEGKRFDSSNDTIDVFEFDINDNTHIKIIQFAMDNSGIKYSIKQLIGLGIVRLVSLLGFQIKNPFSNGRSSYVCVELVSQVLIDYLNYNINKDLDEMTLKDAYDLLKKSRELNIST